MAGDRHLVHPRWVWSGLAVALVGAGLLGIGIAVLSWTTSIAGSVILLVGAAASLRGGVLYDARTRGDFGTEAREVLEGDVHPGITPGDVVDDPAAVRDAVRTDETRRRLEASSTGVSGAGWAPVAGWLLLSVTVVLVVAQGSVVAHTTTGRDNGYRDTGLAILIGLAGLRLIQTPGRHLITAGVTLVCGAALVANGLVADHDRTVTVVVEVAAGCVAVLCALVAWRSPETPHPPSTRGDRPR